MNHDRRKLLRQIEAQLSNIFNDLETIRDEERDSFDNMPEALQSGERGQASEAAADALESAAESAQEALQSCQAALE